MKYCMIIRICSLIFRSKRFYYRKPIAIFLIIAGIVHFSIARDIGEPGQIGVTVILGKPATGQRPSVCRLDRPSQVCVTTLQVAFKMLNSSAWRAALPKTTEIVTLQLSSGTYRLEQGLALHWPAEGPNLIIRGKGSDASFDGATKVVGSRVLTMRNLIKLPQRKSDARLPSDSRYHVWRAAVNAKILDPVTREFAINPNAGELFYRGVAQSLAGWPNVGYSEILHFTTNASSEKTRFGLNGKFSDRWIDEPDLAASGYWFWDWDEKTYFVSAKSTGELAIRGEGSYYGIKPGQRVRIEGALCELDFDGEWYLERSSGLLYFWPPTQVGRSNDISVEWSVVESLLRIDRSSQIVIENIWFDQSRGDLVAVRDSESVVLDRVRLSNSGNRALVVVGGHDNGIRNSLIENAGEGGVLLVGGDRIKLLPARNFVRDSIIRNFSRLTKTYRPAINIDGVGQIVRGNKITFAPHSAIIFQGNDHYIADNEISNVLMETSDSGVIYTGRDYTARGTVIESNFIHDIKSNAPRSDIKGVYLDDQASGILVRGNIFARVHQPMFIGGGRDNLIEDNLFYESSPAVYLDARGLNWQREATLDVRSTLQKRLVAVPYGSPPYSLRYPNLVNIKEDNFGAPKYNIFRRNLIVNSVEMKILAEAASGIVVEQSLVAGEEVFNKPFPVGKRVLLDDFSVKGTK